MVNKNDVRYQIGDTRTLIKDIPSESVDLIITSPPYWNAKDYESEIQIGFNQSYHDYLTELDVVWRECARILVKNGKICINTQPLPIKTADAERSSILNIMSKIENTMESLELELSNLFIWDKRKYNNQMIFGSYPYPPNLYSHVSFEYIYVFRKKGKTKKVEEEIKSQSMLTKDEWREYCFNIFWDIPPVIKYGTTANETSESLSHIAPFPIEIPRRLIKLFSFVGDTVFDPFLGSGTTLGACLLEERKGFGFELNPGYEDLIKLTLMNPNQVPKYSTVDIIKKNRSMNDFLK